MKGKPFRVPDRLTILLDPHVSQVIASWLERLKPMWPSPTTTMWACRERPMKRCLAGQQQQAAGRAAGDRRNATGPGAADRRGGRSRTHYVVDNSRARVRILSQIRARPGKSEAGSVSKSVTVTTNMTHGKRDSRYAWLGGPKVTTCMGLVFGRHPAVPNIRAGVFVTTFLLFRRPFPTNRLLYSKH